MANLLRFVPLFCLLLLSASATPVNQQAPADDSDWDAINGEAVNGTKVWDYASSDPIAKDVTYSSTQDGTKIYAFTPTWPKNNRLTLGSVVEIMNPAFGLGINLLGYVAPFGHLNFEYNRDNVTILFPQQSEAEGPAPWVLKFSR